MVGGFNHVDNDLFSIYKIHNNTIKQNLFSGKELPRIFTYIPQIAYLQLTTYFGFL